MILSTFSLNGHWDLLFCERPVHLSIHSYRCWDLVINYEYKLLLKNSGATSCRINMSLPTRHLVLCNPRRGRRLEMPKAPENPGSY